MTNHHAEQTIRAAARGPQMTGTERQENGMADETTDTKAEREMVRRLFGAPAAEPPARPAGTLYVPREGTGQEQTRPPEYDARDAVGALFGMPENTRNLVDEEPSEPPYVRNLITYPPAPYRSAWPR